MVLFKAIRVVRWKMEFERIVDLESYDCDMLNCNIHKTWNLNSRQGVKNVTNRVI